MNSTTQKDLRAVIERAVREGVFLADSEAAKYRTDAEALNAIIPSLILSAIAALPSAEPKVDHRSKEAVDGSHILEFVVPGLSIAHTSEKNGDTVLIADFDGKQHVWEFGPTAPSAEEGTTGNIPHGATVEIQEPILRPEAAKLFGEVAEALHAASPSPSERCPSPAAVAAACEYAREWWVPAQALPITDAEILKGGSGERVRNLAAIIDRKFPREEDGALLDWLEANKRIPISRGPESKPTWRGVAWDIEGEKGQTIRAAIRSARAALQDSREGK